MVDRFQLTQQLGGAELDEVSIARREQALSQQGVNGFAGTNEISGLFSNPKHWRALLDENSGKSWIMALIQALGKTARDLSGLWRNTSDNRHG
jgi:hypothetical protein